MKPTLYDNRALNRHAKAVTVALFDFLRPLYARICDDIASRTAELVTRQVADIVATKSESVYISKAQLANALGMTPRSLMRNARKYNLPEGRIMGGKAVWRRDDGAIVALLNPIKQ
jgi:hypothetical protein